MSPVVALRPPSAVGSGAVLGPTAGLKYPGCTPPARGLGVLAQPMTADLVRDAYVRFGHLVHRRCQRILRDDAAAEDAIQETFVRLWKYGASYQAADSKLAWLYRVAERCCFDQLARRSGRAEVELAPEQGCGRLSPDAAAALEDGEVVLRFLGRFEPRVQQVAVLHFLDEATHEEIAAATGWSRPTVAKKIEHLRERAAALRPLLYGGGKP